MKAFVRKLGRLGGDYSLVIAGAVGILLSLGVFPLFRLRPNRVSSGIGIGLLQASPLYFVALSLLVIAFALILRSAEKASGYMSAASKPMAAKPGLVATGHVSAPVASTAITGSPRRRVIAFGTFLSIAILLVLLPAFAEGFVKSFAQGLDGPIQGFEFQVPDLGSTGRGTSYALGASSRISLGLGYWAAIGCCVVMYKGAGGSIRLWAGYSRSPGTLGALGFLRSIGIFGSPSILIAVVVFVLAAAGAYDGLSLLKEFALRSQTFGRELLRHVAYGLFPTIAALLIAIPLGWAGSSKPWMDRFFFFIANMAQVVPTLALIGLLIGPLAALGRLMPALGVRGTGWAPASIALFLYALLPLLANAKAGFAMIDPSVRDVAKGMGMKPYQVFFKVELPLASGALAAGFRTAMAQNMGNAVLAGLVGGGGLGSLIFLGLAQAAPDLVLLGSLTVAAAAYGADRGLGRAERRFAAYSKGRTA